MGSVMGDTLPSVQEIFWLDSTVEAVEIRYLKVIIEAKIKFFSDK